MEAEPLVPVVAQTVHSGVLANPEWLYALPSPHPTSHLMTMLKWNQEIFLNISVKLYHLFD